MVPLFDCFRRSDSAGGHNLGTDRGSYSSLVVLAETKETPLLPSAAAGLGARVRWPKILAVENVGKIGFWRGRDGQRIQSNVRR